MATLTPIYTDNKAFDTINIMVFDTYPNACITGLFEVRNPVLETGYLLQKEEIGARHGSCDEKLLYHGTSASSVSLIINDGFDPSKNKRSAYGIGSYFSTKADYSKEYSIPRPDGISELLICKVLIGKCELGYGNKVISTGCDNMVNTMHSPQIYVTPYRYGAVPKYVVELYKDAAKMK